MFNNVGDTKKRGLKYKLKEELLSDITQKVRITMTVLPRKLVIDNHEEPQSYY
jgi:hypothetical protein